MSYAARLKKEAEEAAMLARWKQFMATPVDAPRAKTVELVRFKPEVLARKAHKFLTLAAEYNERERLAKARLDTTDPYRKWLSSIGLKAAEIEPFIARTKGRYSEAA